MPPKPAPTYEPTEHLASDPTTPEHIAMPDADTQREIHPYTIDCSVEDFILRRLRSAELDGEHEERMRVQVIMTNVLFYRGQHEFYVTDDCRVANSYEDEDEDDLIKYNVYGYLVEGKAKEWEAAQPRIEITGRTTDYRLESAARLAEKLDEFVRKASIKAHFRQSEAKFGMLCKVYFRYAMLVRDESDETATRIRVPITENHKFQVGAVHGCAGCQSEFEQEADSQDAKCPECGVAEGHEQISPAFEYSVDVPVDEREEVVPSLRHVSVNPLLVKLDHRARRIQESDYLIFDTLERRYELEADFDDLSDVTSETVNVESASNLPVRLQAFQELERTTSGVRAFAFGNRLQNVSREDDLIRKRRFWMMPKMYAHYRASIDEVVCGVQFKAGERLSDGVELATGRTMKQGWLSIVLGESKLSKIVPESKNKKWAGSAFTLDPTTFHGKGTEDWNSIQMAIDDKATLAQSHFDRSGAPSEIMDTRYVDMDEFDGSTGKRIAIKDSAPADANVDNVHKVVQAGQLGSDFMAYAEREPLMLEKVAGVSAPMMGQADQKNETAKGRQIAAAASSSLLIPSLALRAEEVETETTYQNLEFWQEHAADEDFQLFESEFGKESIETFRSLKLRRDLNVEAVPGSWVPKTKDQELQDMEDFGIKYLAPASQGALPMSFVRHAAGLYNIPSSVFEPERDAKLAQSRLARLRGWADQAMQAGATNLSPPAYEIMLEQIVNQPEFIPNPLMENHAVHMEFYGDQWKSLYGDSSANPILLDLIDKMYQAHVMAMTAAEMKKNELMLKAQAPQIAAKAAMDQHAQDEAAVSGQEQGQLQDGRDHQNKNIDAGRELAVEAGKRQLAPSPTV